MNDISNESRNFDDPNEFDDPQVFDDQKGISIGNKYFDNPKVYDDTSVFDGLVLLNIWVSQNEIIIYSLF